MFDSFLWSRERIRDLAWQINSNAKKKSFEREISSLGHPRNSQHFPVRRICSVSLIIENPSLVEFEKRGFLERLKNFSNRKFRDPTISRFCNANARQSQWINYSKKPIIYSLWNHTLQKCIKIQKFLIAEKIKAKPVETKDEKISR